MFTMQGIERLETLSDYMAEIRNAEISDMEEIAAFWSALVRSLPRRTVDRTTEQVSRIIERLENAAR